MMKYRLYANGRLVGEDCFTDVDDEVPYYDDYLNEARIYE